MTCAIGFLAHSVVYQPREDILDALDSYLTCYHAILTTRLPRAVGEDDFGREKIRLALRNAHVVSDE